jgi:hypothetical protein
MPATFSIDRFEGESQKLAVLVTAEGLTATLPRALLPPGAERGSVVKLSLELDAEATTKLAAETKSLQDELKKTDPGGDISL